MDRNREWSSAQFWRPPCTASSGLQITEKRKNKKKSKERERGRENPKGKTTIDIGAFHGKVKTGFLETDDGDLLVLDEIGSTVEIHGGILERVKNLTGFESFRTSIGRKLRDIWNVAESSDAEYNEVHHHLLQIPTPLLLAPAKLRGLYLN